MRFGDSSQEAGLVPGPWSLGGGGDPTCSAAPLKLTSPKNDGFVSQANLNDSHNQMVVHWAGEKSNVIVALARDSTGSTGPRTSSVNAPQWFRPASHPPGPGRSTAVCSSRPGLCVLRLRNHLHAGLRQVPAARGPRRRGGRGHHLPVLPQPCRQQAGRYQQQQAGTSRHYG